MRRFLALILFPFRWIIALFAIRVEPTFKNPLSAWPRNAPCLCGGPAKFKYCCGHDMPAHVTRRELNAFVEARPYLRATLDAKDLLAQVASRGRK